MINIENLQSDMQTFLDTVNGKSLEELGGQEGFNDIIFNELLNIYIWIQALAVNANNFETVYVSNFETIDANFSAFDTALETIAKNMSTQNEAFNKALNTSITRLSAQMSNQNKALDKTVIKLSKSISKITGE